MGDFTFYFGAASGGSRKALRRLQEPNVMISYATQNNQPWDGIDNLFIDSGGYSLMLDEGEHPPVEEYLGYVRDVEPAYYALQDYPCEPDILEEYGRTVEDHIDRTVDRHIECLDHGGSGEPVPVLQGWELDDYMDCIDAFRDHGLLPAGRVGIGSVCRRHAEMDIRDIIVAVSEEIDAGLHGFGVKTSVLNIPGVASVLESADSLAYDMAARYNHGTGRWEANAIEYLRMKMKIEAAIEFDDDQQTLMEATADVQG